MKPGNRHDLCTGANSCEMLFLADEVGIIWTQPLLPCGGRGFFIVKIV